MSIRCSHGVIALAAIAALVAVVGAPPAFALVTLGVKAGPSYSHLAVEGFGVPHDINYGTRSEVALGASARLRFNRSIGVRVEGLYVRMGSEVTYDDPTDGVDHEHRNDYLVVPVMLELRFDDDTVQPFALVGVALGLTVNQEVVFADPDIERRDVLTDNDFAFAWGAGVGIPVGDTVSFLLEGRYFFGFNDIGVGREVDVTNRSAVFMAGVEVDL